MLKTKKLFYLNEIAKSGVKKEAGFCIVGQLPILRAELAYTLSGNRDN